MDQRIPVTLLTGFLGSGKTTLLNRLLTNPAMQQSAVIINELGDAGLDHILAQNVESSYVADNAVLLASGCLCCTLSNELADTMRDLFFKRAVAAIPAFNRLVIETTGMADPGPIMANLMNEPVIESVYRLDAVVVTIDAQYGQAHIEAHQEARKQVAVADVLLLTKTDLTTASQLAALQATLASINESAAQHTVLHGAIAAEHIIDVGLFDPSGKHAAPERWLRAPTQAARGLLARNHAHAIHSFTVTLPMPLKWAELKPRILRLCQQYGAQLLRLKGIIHAEDQPAPLAIHAVHFTPYPPTLLTGWEEAKPVSRIVLIGQDLDEPAIRKALMQF